MSDDAIPPPARDADEAARQAAAIRGRIDQDLRALESRLPPPARLRAQAKTYGSATAAGLGLVGAAGLAIKQRQTRQAQDKEARRQAEALARALPDAALQVRQVQVSTRWGGLALVVSLAALGAAAWAVLAGRRRGGAEEDWRPVGPAPSAEEAPPPPPNEAT